MKDDFNALRSKYPSYQIWVTGHSLGGAMATLAASYIVAAKLVPASDVQLALASSYRVTHSRDVVPHTFYHNDMKNGATFKTCTGDEDKGCSDGLDITISISDHLHYFDKDVSGYGESGCK
ncbi:unnamed protein product [Nippostrongylus brasiliensis]|uniref:Lipase_3 domain-containing protein n=1 Tax=Nippostrongylus brasiliensis TaxID=27835 RepID=A0A158QYS7_NIPBR|nr:unnamed protein product [Nippostrongylus brasiliensis]